ncbi:hypothetical protein [Schaalia canis]|uniref:Uncharacterized protein n=1 Tax=Schaalia canis TaxID=100469 RepID=A0A3P1SE19_9ACTO|nr:hypothetical protein [Schaalia canis]RRC95227.1 hypothetical protein EII11_06225 [Schaalia canis]
MLKAARRQALWSVTIGAIVLAGCTATEAEDTSRKQEPVAESAAQSSAAEVTFDPSRMPIFSDELPVKDRKQWTLPTDPYFDHRDWELETAAQVLMRVECMNQRGFTEEKMHLVPFAPRSESYGPGGERLFNEELAGKYGYRLAPDPSQVPGVPYRDPQSESHEQRMADSECDLIARARFDGISVEEWKKRNYEAAPGTDSGDASFLGSEADMALEVLEAQATVGSQLNRLHADRQAPALVAAAGRWNECMQPLGIPDLPDQPWDVTSVHALPESLQERWVSFDDSSSPNADAASADEIAVAVHDAQCRESSGWNEELYEAEWAIREEFVTAHREELRSQFDGRAEKAARALQILAEYGYK